MNLFVPFDIILIDIDFHSNLFLHYACGYFSRVIGGSPFPALCCVGFSVGFVVGWAPSWFCLPFLKMSVLHPSRSLLSPYSHETILSPDLGDNMGSFLGVFTNRGTNWPFFSK